MLKELRGRLVAVALGATLLGSTKAGDSYPVPFSNVPDWRGVVTSLPVPGAVVLRTHTLSRSLVVVRLISKLSFIDASAPARMAYQNLFANVDRLPPEAEYIVMVIYGPINRDGVSPEFAYVFKRNAASHSWSRSTTEKELLAIECAIGQCPNH